MRFMSLSFRRGLWQTTVLVWGKLWALLSNSAKCYHEGMNALLVLTVLLAALFVLAYITKRRFGVLGLALCAGSLLSASWTSTLTPWIESQGVVFVSPPLSAVVSTLLILGPALLLLFSGPTYSSQLQRIVGAAAFALLAFVFLLQPIGIAFVFNESTSQIYNTVQQSSNLIIVIGILAALGDILITRTPRRRKKAEH